MGKYAIITDNGGGQNAVWHDVAGEEYYFPVQYQNILTKGTLVVYHRGKKKADSPTIPDRMSDESHYFGIARIGEVTETPDGNFRAEILDFEKFKYPVDIHRPEGPYYEVNPFFQQGVRRSEKFVYDDIIAASKVPPTPVEPKSVKRKGIKSLANLQVIKRSNSFAEGKYEIVTSAKGYYIYNVSDKLYYKLEKPEYFQADSPILKVLPGKNGSYLIMHAGSRIGMIEIKTNGVLYRSMVSPGLGTIMVNM